MINPWKAFQPYDEGSAANFKGREENVRELSSIILKNQTSVCYAESGIGKSSLINAGLKPVFRQKNLFPVDVLFTEEKLCKPDFDFDGFVISRILDTIEEQNSLAKGFRFELKQIKKFDSPELKSMDEKLSKSSLWWILHTRSISFQAYGMDINFSPILIFDQFEEIFNNNVKEEFIVGFFNWFQKTSASCMPSEIEERLNELNIEEISELPDWNQCKFVFSLRQDAMGILDYWITQRMSVPALKTNRYCLRALTREQAMRVITEQGVDTLNLAAEQIIDEIAEKNSDSVPAILLSVFCSRLFDKSATLSDGTKAQVRKEDVSANRLTLIRDFYEYLLGKAGIKEKHIRIIEDCLVSESTGKRKRTESEHPRLESIGFNEHYKTKLLNCYLISRTTIEGTEYIEISHDKVAEVISTRQRERKLKRNLNNWRFLLFLLPVFLIVASYAYLIIPKEGDLDRIEFILMQQKRGGKDFRKIPLGVAKNDADITNIIYDNINIDIEVDHLKKIIIEESKPLSALNLEFKNCPNLSDVWLSENIAFIPKSAFVNCNNLTVHIHPDVQEIHHSAFECANVEFDIDTLNTHFIWKDGVLWDLSETDHPAVYIKEELLNGNRCIPFIDKYKDCESITYRGQKIYNYKTGDLKIYTDNESLVPSYAYRFAESIDMSAFVNIKNIPARSFKECERLKEIILPPHLEYIGEQAFAECCNLRNISFPATLKNIDRHAFANCTNLENIEFEGEAINNIESFAFANCRSLTDICFPTKLIERLEDYAFIDCESLQSVTLPDRSGFLSSFIFHRCNSLNEINIRDEGGIYVTKDGYLLSNDGDFLLAKADARIEYNAKKHFSKNGIVFKESSIRGFNQHSVNSPDLGLFNITSEQDSILRLGFGFGDCVFVQKPINLKEIHIPYTSPDLYAQKYHLYLRIDDLPKSIKKNITLVVPKGCADNYVDHPAFQGYKDIKENNLITRVKDITRAVQKEIVDTFKMDRLILYAAVLALLLTCVIFFYASYQAIKNKGDKGILYSLLTALVNIVFILMTFIGFYWFSDIVLNANKYISAIVAVIACAIVTILLCAMGQMTFKGLWKNRKKLLKQNTAAIAVIVKIVVVILVAIGSYFLFVDFKAKRDDYVKKVMELCKESDTDYPILKACLSRNTIAKRLNKRPIPIQSIKTGANLLEISPDGEKIFTANGADIIIWDLKTLNPLDTLKEHRDYISDINISVNGKYLISCSYDKTIVWDTENGKKVEQLGFRDRSCAISSDGKTAVTGSSSVDFNNIVDVETHTIKHSLKGKTGQISKIRFSADDSRVVTGYEDGTAIIWDASTGKKITLLEGHSGEIQSINFSPDGNKVITGSSDKTAIIWDADTGEKLDILTGNTNLVSGAKFSSDGKHIITCSYDLHLSVWDAQTGKQIYHIKENSSFFDMSSSDDDKYIVTCSYDDKLTVWGNGRNLHIPDLTDKDRISIYRLGFKYDKWYIWIIITYVLTLILGLTYLLSPESTRHIYKRYSKIFLLIIIGFLLFFAARNIAAARKIKPIKIKERIWKTFNDRNYDECLDVIFRNFADKDLYNKDIIKYLKAICSSEIIFRFDEWDYYSRIAHSISGDTIAVCKNNSNLTKIIEPATGKLIKGIVNDGLINRLEISKSGKLLAEASDSQITVKETETGKIVSILGGGLKSRMFFSPDESMIITLKDYPMIWDVETGKCLIKEVWSEDYLLYSSSISGDGSRLAVSSNKSTMVINTSTGQKTSSEKYRYCRDMVMNTDGSLLITTEEKSVNVLDENFNLLYKTSGGHDRDIRALAISPDGKRFASGSDNTVVIWEIETGNMLHKMLVPGGVSEMNFCDNDTIILEFGKDIIRWNVKKHSTMNYEECVKQAKDLYLKSKTR